MNFAINSTASVRIACALSAFALVACASPQPFRKPPTVDLDERAMNVWQAIRSGDALQMGRDFDPRVDRAFPKKERASFLAGLRQKFGEPSSIELPKKRKRFEATYPLHFAKGDLEMRLSANEKFAIIGITIGVAKPIALARNKTAVAFPLDGLALVASAGEDGEGGPARFEHEFIALDSAGRVRKGDGRQLADYACFGRKARAPAAGTVSEAMDGAHDNAIGEANSSVALGNFVLIAHGANEASMLTHLKRGSVRVKAGQTVRRGQVVGECGNSGDSPSPRLGFSMRDEAAVGKGTPLRIQFIKLKKFGKAALDDGLPERVALAPRAEAAADYEPSRGDVVEDASRERSSGRSRDRSLDSGK